MRAKTWGLLRILSPPRTTTTATLTITSPPLADGGGGATDCCSSLSLSNFSPSTATPLQRRSPPHCRSPMVVVAPSKVAGSCSIRFPSRLCVAVLSPKNKRRMNPSLKRKCRRPYTQPLIFHHNFFLFTRLRVSRRLKRTPLAYTNSRKAHT